MVKAKIGFDIGSNNVSVALLKGGEIRLETVRLPENMVDSSGSIVLPHAFTQLLKQLKKELALPMAPAALVLPPSQAICRLVNLPRMTTEQLLLNLPYEFSDFIQGVADQYFCDYAVCTPTEAEMMSEEGGVPMMAAVAAKQTLAEYAQMFAKAGISLKSILPQEMALVSLVQHRSKELDSEEFCFVDLGHYATRITVVWRDRVQATRQIALGGRNLDLLLADELGVDAFLANTYKLSNYQDILSAAGVAELFDRIAVEILKVINFYQFTFRSSNLSGIYLVGGGAALQPLRQAIENALGLPLLDPAQLLPQLISTAEASEAAMGVFAAGAAVGEN